VSTRLLIYCINGLLLLSCIDCAHSRLKIMFLSCLAVGLRWPPATGRPHTADLRYTASRGNTAVHEMGSGGGGTSGAEGVAKVWSMG
jgi:hypothetical protein